MKHPYPSSSPYSYRPRGGRRWDAWAILVLILVLLLLGLVLTPIVVFGGLWQASQYQPRPVVNIENRYIVAPTRTPVVKAP